MLQDAWDAWILALYYIIKENKTKEDKTEVQPVINLYLSYLDSGDCKANVPVPGECLKVSGRSPYRKRKAADFSTGVSPLRLAKRLRRLDKDEILIPQCRRSGRKLKQVIASANHLKQLLLQGHFKTVYETFDLQENPELQYKNFSRFLRGFLIKFTEQPLLNEEDYKKFVKNILSKIDSTLQVPDLEVQPGVGRLLTFKP